MAPPRSNYYISRLLRTIFGVRYRDIVGKWRASVLTEWEEVPCNLCGSERRQKIGSIDKFKLKVTSVICLDCGLIYINPRPTEDCYRRFYESGGDDQGVYHADMSVENVEQILQSYLGEDYRVSKEDWVKVEAYKKKYMDDGDEDAAEFEVREQIELSLRTAEDIYHSFKDFVPAGSKIFEVGASWGYQLVPWRDWHECEVSGVEPQVAAVQRAKERLDIDLYQGFSDHPDIPREAFDAVLNLRAINHMLDPLNELRRQWKMLKPRGMLFLDNQESLLKARYSGFDGTTVEIDHPYMFSVETLCAMVEKAGFEIIMTSIIDSRHVIKTKNSIPRFRQIRLAAKKSVGPHRVRETDAIDELAALALNLDHFGRTKQLNARFGSR